MPHAHTYMYTHPFCHRIILFDIKNCQGDNFGNAVFSYRLLLFGVKGESFIIVKKMPPLTKSSIDFDVLLSVFNRHFSHLYNRADTFVVF